GHVVSAQQSDAAGNTSLPGATAFTSGALPPAVIAPADGVVLTAAPAAITGTGHPGAEVTVTLNGQPIGQTTVNEPPADTEWLAATAPGLVSWSVPVPDLAEGSYTTVATERFGGATVGTTTSTFSVVAAPVTTQVEPAADDDGRAGMTGLLVALGLGGVAVLVVLLRRRRARQAR
ncbi:hypothetical protein, partial [Actinophytocola sp.]|uniref:hypothetical protein n=1 Tax=Actinophytocola sp. TaxID=1872138 RepID=UPI002D80CC2A